VTFTKLLSDAAAKVKERHIKHKTKTNFDRYQHSPRLKLSRLYGYKLREDGKAERVQEEARVIQRVFNMFVEHKSAEEIKAALDTDDIRTRFNDRWTVAQVMAMIKPIYAGVVVKKSGGIIRSDVYPPIVTEETWRKAQKELRKQVQAAEIDPVTAVWGSRKDTPGVGISK
jgi:Recombinase